MYLRSGSPLYSVSLSSMCHWLLLVRKLPLAHCFSLELRVIVIERSVQVRPHLFNIWTVGAMDITSGQSEVELSLLRSISLKIRPLVHLPGQMWLPAVGHERPVKDPTDFLFSWKADITGRKVGFSAGKSTFQLKRFFFSVYTFYYDPGPCAVREHVWYLHGLFPTAGHTNLYDRRGREVGSHYCTVSADFREVARVWGSRLCFCLLKTFFVIAQ